MNYRFILRHRPQDVRGFLSTWGFFSDTTGRVHVPENEQDRFSTFLTALGKAEGDAALHMESGVRVNGKFRSVVEDVILEDPHRMVQFFSMRKKDLTEGSRWDRNFMMTTCFYLPSGWSEELLDYLPRWREIQKASRAIHYDEGIADWVKETGRKFWIHCPNPVDRVTNTQWVSKTYRP